MFAVMVSKINYYVNFPTVTMQSFILLLSTVVIEGLTELDVKEGEIEIEEGRMEIKEYVFLEEQLIPKTYIINQTRVKKVIKALGVI